MFFNALLCLSAIILAAAVPQEAPPVFTVLRVEKFITNIAPFIVDRTTTITFTGSPSTKEANRQGYSLATTVMATTVIYLRTNTFVAQIIADHAAAEAPSSAASARSRMVRICAYSKSSSAPLNGYRTIGPARDASLKDGEHIQASTKVRIIDPISEHSWHMSLPPGL
ncbi:hypothetical protein C8J57DRAFT_1212240 [Mycena rebaudengoi]|nr:hypothetical protein C8J57DRAFT_1212240 [Mycena rebaudengoi]